MRLKFSPRARATCGVHARRLLIGNLAAHADQDALRRSFSRGRLIHKRKNWLWRIGNALLSHNMSSRSVCAICCRRLATLLGAEIRGVPAKKAIGLVRTKLAKSRGERAVGHVQRAWAQGGS